MTPDEKRRLKQAELTATRALARIKKKPDVVGMERFGEDKWLCTDDTLLALMVYAIGTNDGEEKA